MLEEQQQIEENELMYVLTLEQNEEAEKLRKVIFENDLTESWYWAVNPVPTGCKHDGLTSVLPRTRMESL